MSDKAIALRAVEIVSKSHAAQGPVPNTWPATVKCACGLEVLADTMEGLRLTFAIHQVTEALSEEPPR